ncbi:MAG: CHAD domain-containing protein [Ferrovibrio sp.]|uniref:CHAD domain-containing protein n=1 Tax=Ferrovibrio sp. TaxID=1917215 RepID=UPI00260DFE41|nr:CHAD domain-containing protein [Ferrovibrio sp.]MCW0234365.1 CHAD domain-containing protein [Ferrovibrio sp.]
MSEPPALLRFGLAPGGLALVRRHAVFAERKSAGKRSRVLKSSLSLLDTPDRSFAAAGWLCLAIADPQGRRIVTLPIAGVALDTVPSLDAIDDLDTLAEGTLSGQVHNLTQDGHAVMLQSYKVQLRAADQRATYEALTLQAAPDAAMAMDALAAALVRDLPLRWTGTAPLVQAACHLGMIEPPPVRSAILDFALPDDVSVAAAFAIVLRHCLAQFDANLLPVLRDRDQEGVHQMRVALRRLRSAIGLFAPILDNNALQPLLDDLRWLGAPLGRKRDLDVFITETLNPLRSQADPPKRLQHLATILEDHRAAAQVALESALNAPRLAALRLALARFVAAIESGDPAVLADTDAATGPAMRFAAALLRKRHKKVKALGRRHAELDIPALHELRIQAKKLRYTAEFFRLLFARRKTSRRFIAALAHLQDCLGMLNDADVGARLVRDLLPAAGEDPAAAAIAAWFAGRQQLQPAQLGEAWDSFAAIKPFWKGAGEG